MRRRGRDPMVRHSGDSTMWWAILVCLGFPAAGWFSPVWADPGVFPEAAPPGATVTISGKGFGQFKTTQDNRVLFNGSPALIQRWEPDLLEVKVPLRATSGPVEVIRGKKRIAVEIGRASCRERV